MQVNSEQKQVNLWENLETIMLLRFKTKIHVFT
jgi:hypothetical protein